MKTIVIKIHEYETIAEYRFFLPLGEGEFFVAENGREYQVKNKHYDAKKEALIIEVEF